jgi:poly-gamma-glutamate synthesis protein (capsule biosynthesis protein)
VPVSWAARNETPGINLLKDLSSASVQQIASQVRRHKRPGDVAILSIHWGGNWGFKIPDAHRRFAQELIDKADVSIVHGHSSHHPMAMENYHNRLILYGCGDFLNDYEGISGHEQFLDDLTLMYFVELDLVSGGVRRVEMVPFRIQRFQLVPASSEDTELLLHTLDRECRKVETRVIRKPDHRLALTSTSDQIDSSSESAAQGMRKNPAPQIRLPEGR